MHKIQILFPEPVLERLRGLSATWDRPVSDLVRRAVDDFLTKNPPPARNPAAARLPVFNGGAIRVDAEAMGEAPYMDRLTLPNSNAERPGK